MYWKKLFQLRGKCEVRRWIATKWMVSLAVGALLLGWATPLPAQNEKRLNQVEVGPVGTFVAFSKAAGELPEGVVMDNAGNLYVSLAPLGQIRKIDPFGVMTLFATLGTPPFPGAGALGLEADLLGNVYVAVASFEADSHGVWRISPDGTPARLPGSQAISFPNSLAFDERGNLYVTDSILVTATGLVGRVWKIPPGGAAEVWSDDPLLAGEVNPLSSSLGANGIAYSRGRVLVANTTKRHIVQIPVLPDGSAGTVEVVASMDDFLPPEVVTPLPFPVPPFLDGISVDAQGNLYAAVVGQHKLVRLPPDGSSLEVLADFDDGLQLPASLAFGTTRGTRTTLFITNFVFLGGLNNAAVLKVDVGIPGPPVIGQPLVP